LDAASKILDHGVLDDELKVMKDVQKKTKFDKVFFRVQWKERTEGVKPASTYYPFSMVKLKCPEILLDYIQQMTCSESE